MNLKIELKESMLLLLLLCVCDVCVVVVVVVWWNCVLKFGVRKEVFFFGKGVFMGEESCGGWR